MITTTYKTTTEELDKRMREETEYGFVPFGWAERDSYSGTLTLGDDWHSNAGHYYELVVGEDEFFILEYRRSGRYPYLELASEMQYQDLETAFNEYMYFDDQAHNEYDEREKNNEYDEYEEL